MNRWSFPAWGQMFTVLDLYQLQNEPDAEPRHFGVCVSSLTSERNSVPVVMEKLLEYVEMHGLYTEGIYRKSGSANRMKELKQLLQAGLAVLSTFLTSLHTSLPSSSLLSESIWCFSVDSTQLFGGHAGRLSGKSCLEHTGAISRVLFLLSCCFDSVNRRFGCF